MKTYLFLILAFLLSPNMVAQVGIGTISPTAELEINATGTLPALEITPQATPTGTATGQLAVIGDKLYMYDVARGKWLSVQAVPFQYTRNGSLGTQTLFFGRTNSGNTGPLMPFDGTIVAVTGKASALSAATKRVQVRVRNGNTNISNTNTDLVNATNSLNNTTIDVDFSAGDYISVRGRNSPGGATATNVAMIVWVKWRQ